MSGVLASTEQECMVTLSHPNVGSLTFHEADGAPKDLPFALSLLAGEETSFGNPTPMVEVIESLISEGAQAYVQGWENRVFPLTLRCEADSGEALSQFEDTLMRIILAAGPGAMATLRYVPPARESAPTNFDVQTMSLTRVESDRWDLDESQRLTRYWRVDFTTLPFVRPDEPVVIEASPLPPDPGAGVTSEEIAPTASWTGWTPRAIPADAWWGSLTADTTGGHIRVAGNALRTGSGVRLIARHDSGNANTAAWPLIKVRTRLTGPGSAPYDPKVELSFDGGALQPLVAKVRDAATSGFITSWFEAPADGWSATVGINATIPGWASKGTYRLEVEEVSFVDGINAGPGTTSREQNRSLAVPGAAPTMAQLAGYTDEEANLGETVLIHTANDPSAFTPPLRPYLHESAAVTTDAALVSGASNDLSTPTRWLVPVSQLLAGTHALAARLRRTAGATTRSINWSAKLVDAAGADILGSDVVVSGSTPITLADTAWRPKVIASMTLPPLGLDVSDAYVLIEVSTSAGAEVLIDQGWLLDTTHGMFTLLDLTGAAVSWVECRTPDLGAPLWQVYGGTGGSGQVAGQDLGRYVLAFGRHRFLPGDMKIFTVTSAAQQSQTRGKMYARHHSHVTYGADQATTPAGLDGSGSA